MNLNVLIIEDKGLIGIHIKRIVVSLGCRVLMVVKNGSDALKIAQKNRIDLVVSDINIEGEMDGVECCQILHTTYNIPIVFLTAYHDVDTLQKASKVDFVGYLIKPFREDELEAMVRLVAMKYKPVSKTLKKYDICEKYSYSQSENKLFFDNTHITLTRKENSFLLLLIRANGSLVSYESMENTIWNGERVDDGTRRQLVHRFKQKAQNFPLELVKGFGYKLNLKTPKK